MSNALVSIVMAAYNAEKYIAMAIGSVLRSTHTNIQLIVVDDGSTDQTYKEAEQFAEDKRLVLCKKKHSGITDTLIEASALAAGKYIGVVDDDDILHADAIKLCVAALEKEPKASFVYTDHADIEDNGEYRCVGSRCKEDYSYRRLLERFITHHFRLVDRQKFYAVGGWNDLFKYAVDYDLCLRLAELSDPVRVRRILYYYRRHSGNSSKIYKEQQDKFARLASVMAQDRMRKVVICPRCSHVTRPLDVHGHVECTNCHAVIDSCCTGETVNEQLPTGKCSRA